MPKRALFQTLLLAATLLPGSGAPQAAEPSAIESDLVVTVHGEEPARESRMKRSNCSTFPPPASR
jgi:hypothetical protein